MGEARQRAKMLANGEPVTVRLGDKSRLRLAMLLAQAQGSAQAAEVLANLAKADDARWRDAVAVEFDARELSVPPEWDKHYDADEGTITARPKPTPLPGA